MIDVNAFLGEWPFRRLPYAQPEDRLRKMDDARYREGGRLALGERLL